MKTVSEFLLESPSPETKFVVFYGLEGGAAVFNSVENKGQLVQYYSVDELAQFADLPVLETPDFSGLVKAGLLGETKKVVVSEETAHGLRFL